MFDFMRVAICVLILSPIWPLDIAYAGFVNPSFESGDLSGWQIHGTARVESEGSFGITPANGQSQALVWSHQPGEFALSVSELESFLNVGPGTLSDLSTGEVAGGSAIKQTFNASAGDTLRFDWAFLTNNEPNDPDFNSFAFVVISPESPTLGLGDTFAGLTSSNSGYFLYGTEYSLFEHVFSNSGTYTLAVGVVDVGDDLVSSGLLFDNATLVSAVPEPTSLAFTGILLAVGFATCFKLRIKPRCSAF